ncbi:putative methyltransferase NSUN6 [Leptonychotes weddellii]|uniref:Methyltransferase NSUN6 n=1 Tax=Leptonychotes weddellii TaxID=9713 RepID=A0A2U3XYE2_LEPWE|nr:putative methyltransferase NSUN6 [Leptonychotes weddellii]
MSIFPKISLRLEVEKYLKEGFMNKEVVSTFGKQEAERKFETLLNHLSHPPSFTTVRVNTHLASVQHVKDLLFDELQKQFNGLSVPILQHPDLQDVLLIPVIGPRKNIKKQHCEAVVGAQCGNAVLRGAHVYVPGIVSASKLMKAGDVISVYSDIKGKCKKGAKEFDGTKVFLGNGISELSRKEIFSGLPELKYVIKCLEEICILFGGSRKIKTIYLRSSVDSSITPQLTADVDMPKTEFIHAELDYIPDSWNSFHVATVWVFGSSSTSGVEGVALCKRCPTGHSSAILLPWYPDTGASGVFPEWALCVLLLWQPLGQLQVPSWNLPSAVVTHVLDPQPGEKILDLCAAPGGKTTHIAALMHDQGEVIALDKISNKVEKIKQNALLLGLNSIKAFCFDGTKALKLNTVKDAEGKPPFLPESFDRILLDAPCSGMGQRPNMVCSWTLKEVTSYQPLQRKLFTVAVELLKPGGVLVYSTCTITLAENEEQVAWALRTFPYLQLQPQEPQIGGEGMMGAGLSLEQLKQLQRFDPSVVPLRDTDIDSLRDARIEDMIWLANKDCIGFFIAKFIKCKST